MRAPECRGAVQPTDRGAHVGDGVCCDPVVLGEAEVLALRDADGGRPRAARRDGRGDPAGASRAPSMRLPPPRRRTSRVRARRATSTAISDDQDDRDRDVDPLRDAAATAGRGGRRRRGVVVVVVGGAGRASSASTAATRAGAAALALDRCPHLDETLAGHVQRCDLHARRQRDDHRSGELEPRPQAPRRRRAGRVGRRDGEDRHADDALLRRRARDGGVRAAPSPRRSPSPRARHTEMRCAVVR